MNYKLILALLLSFCTFLPVLGQTATQTTPQTRPTDDKDDVVKITTNLVQIDAVVTKDGKPVPNLKAEDFEIYEDGRKQNITSFAYISNVGTSPSAAPDNKSAGTPAIPGAPAAPIQRDLPRRTIAIVVDDLGLSAESIRQVRRQVRKFIAEQIEPNDLVAIIRTGGEMGALQQFTNDARLLSRAVDQLRWNVCSRVGVSVFNRIGGPGGQGDDTDPCGGQSYRKTRRALEFILDAMGQLPGRKSLILMSDSLPMENQEGQFETADSFSEARSRLPNADSVADQGFVSVGPNSRNYYWALRKIAEKAIRSSVVIYAVDTQGLQYTGITAADSIPTPIRQGEPAIKQVMVNRSRTLLSRREGGEMIARQTGGFQVRNSNGFQLDRIMEDQRGYYLIGYRPSVETFNRKFHHIKAKVKRSGMNVRTRFGFFGVTEEEAERTRPTPQDNTNLALLSPFGVQDLELDVDAFFANSKDEGSIVRSFVYLNAANLTFTPGNDRHETSLELHGVIFGDNGTIVEQIKGNTVLSLKQNEYEQALRDGLRLRFDMPAKRPGSYQVRIAVRDRNSSKIGSAGQFVAVPDLRNNQLAMSGVVLRAASESATQGAVGPAGQRFRINSEVEFAFVIYNAAIDPATQSPNLVMETKLFRDGKSVKSNANTPISSANQPDLARLVISGVMRLQEDLEPGNYYLQVVITDKAAKDKQPPVTQWVDFDIVK
ncbi:MAG: VWA domain-containing protein [Acidobacteria bacterium]|nr:VWA domain-containing protein [Acidobacteriota bacterium]MCA1627330.1 VWA domain-containing protein [Acidobacteriota bacterium]